LLAQVVGDGKKHYLAEAPVKWEGAIAFYFGLDNRECVNQRGGNPWNRIRDPWIAMFWTILLLLHEIQGRFEGVDSYRMSVHRRRAPVRRRQKENALED
jgi:hypothetical protein